MTVSDLTALESTQAGAGLRRRSLDRILDSVGIWPVMVTATALYLLVFVGYPVVYNVVMSLQDVTVSNLRSFDRPWVGLANYERIFSDPLFPLVLRNTAIFVGLNVALQCIGGLAAALFFQQQFPGASFLRGLVLAGWILPPLVIGAVWKWLLASDNGILNYALQSLGLLDSPVFWLSDPSTSLVAVTMANVWFGLPFNMILIAAGLAGIPRDLYEAAALDGAGPIRRFLSITLPLLRPTLYALVALSTIYTMRAFDLIWTMTHGGPVDSSNIFPVWSYRLSFEVFDFAGGAAISTLMLLVVFLVALVYVRSVRAEKQV
jgi:multiple sugar transport system permease protein